MDRVLVNARLATMRAGGKPYGEADADAIAFEGGRIAWIGRSADAPAARERSDAAGRWLTPGLIDCHTHLVYAGDREHEFEQRLTGVSYEEIARAGGGIRSTIGATRAASEDALVALARERLGVLAREGVTTVEIKSGYAQDLPGEMKLLRAARRAGAEAGVAVRTTLLALHALPDEFANRPDDYVDLACRQMIPAAAREGLADAVDAFCESIAFTPAQTDRLFAAAGTVAVLLPGAYFFLRETKLPPVDALRARGVPIAIATDHNPGTSPYLSLLLMLNMACTAFRLTPEEALAGVTREAARALGLAATHGTLEVGKAADAVLWDIPEPAALAYSYGAHEPMAVYRGGRA